MDSEKMTIDMHMLTPFMRFNADYEMEGQVLVLPLSGKGDCVINFSKSVAHY
jgi:hypothetical protein